jgi:sec-independent protein translocase protein TatC
MVDRRPRVYGPLELLLTELKVAALGGLVIGLPAFVYETYLFMRPGLYPKERRYYLAAVPTSLVLAFVGIAFAHFIVLPAIFAYFTSYTTGTAVVAFGLKETFNLILILMGYNAIIFQIPLFVMLAIMMNLVTRVWLEDRRLLFWGTFLGLAFLVSPDPTGMAPIIVGATMIALFEGTLFALRWTARGSLIPTAEGLAARRPQAAVLAALVGYLLSPLPVPTGYYDLLPSAAVETLAANGLAVYTPLLIAGALVGLFELVSLLLRRYGRSRRLLRVRLALDSARRPVWLVAVVVGYLGSPDPAVLRWAAELNLPPALAAGIAVGLVLGYEGLRLLLASREDRAA